MVFDALYMVCYVLGVASICGVVEGFVVLVQCCCCGAVSCSGVVLRPCALLCGVSCVVTGV